MKELIKNNMNAKINPHVAFGIFAVTCKWALGFSMFETIIASSLLVIMCMLKSGE